MYRVLRPGRLWEHAIYVCGIDGVLALNPCPLSSPPARAGGGGDGDDSGASDDDDVAANRPGGAAMRANRRGSGRSSARPLSRPIICICNDLYAPQLRPLRDVARVFHFTPPSTERLVARLSYICTAEGVAAEPAALRLLAERTERDVRACLNTLQFLARRRNGGHGAGGHGEEPVTIEAKVRGAVCCSLKHLGSTAPLVSVFG